MAHHRDTIQRMQNDLWILVHPLIWATTNRNQSYTVNEEEGSEYFSRESSYFLGDVCHNLQPYFSGRTQYPIPYPQI